MAGLSDNAKESTWRRRKQAHNSLQHRQRLACGTPSNPSRSGHAQMFPFEVDPDSRMFRRLHAERFHHDGRTHPSAWQAATTSNRTWRRASHGILSWEPPSLRSTETLPVRFALSFSIQWGGHLALTGIGSVSAIEPPPCGFLADRIPWLVVIFSTVVVFGTVVVFRFDRVHE